MRLVCNAAHKKSANAENLSAVLMLGWKRDMVNPLSIGPKRDETVSTPPSDRTDGLRCAFHHV